MSLEKVLKGMVDTQRVPHALMLHEDDGGGAVTLALKFLQYLFCKHKIDGEACEVCPSCHRISKMIHPDVHFIFPIIAGKDTYSTTYANQFRELVLSNPYFTEADLNEALASEKKQRIIAVSEANALLSQLSLSSLEGGYRAVIFLQPEKMNIEAANKLLKEIEEPSPQTIFIFVTHSPENVIATIRSRCQMLRVPPRKADARYDEQHIQLFEDLMTALVSRDMYASLEQADKLSALSSRDNAKAFCKYASSQMRQIFLTQQNIGEGGEGSKWAGKCKKTFPRMAQEALDKASLMIDRNVNQKLLFTDLVNRLIMIV